MNAPLFSVAIPTFNRSDLVTHAIQSVLAQTFDNFEIIVCDNFSTDDTAEAIGRFTDPRVQYKRTPSHLVIADNWEFARSKAIGKFILMLGDDDALVGSALERFAQDIKRYDADFLFCRTSEYRDRGYPGPEKNTLDCPSFSGLSRSIQAGEFLQPLFSFRPAFDMHPSAFIFSRSL
ncbi:MAG: glycosyltransferase family 2 protein, partial [Nitrospiraceae bacterium]